MIQIIQRARSEHSVLEIFGCDVVMTQMQYRDNNKPVVNAGPGIPKQWSKSGIHDQSRVSGLMCTSCCSFLPVSRASRLPTACGVSLDVRSLRTLGDIRVAPYTTVELVVLRHPLWLGLPHSCGSPCARRCWASSPASLRVAWHVVTRILY